MDVSFAPLPQDTLHAEATDALSRGLVTPAEVAGLSDGELGALVALCRDALAVKEVGRAQKLARALVVLSPYWGVAWRLLAQTLQAQNNDAAAAWALEAVALLTPPQHDADPGVAGATGAADELASAPAAHVPATPARGDALLVHDGRPLPLTQTPAARHHDTVGARRASAALMTPQSRGDTARWAQTTQEVQKSRETAPPVTGTWPQASLHPAAEPPESILATGTAVVRRAALPGASDPRLEPESALDATGKIARPAPARAAARRRLGWPITDTWSPDEPTHTAITPR